MRISQGHFLSTTILEPIADVRNRKLVAGSESPAFDPFSVDPDPICTTKIPDDDLLLVLRHATMMA